MRLRDDETIYGWKCFPSFAYLELFTATSNVTVKDEFFFYLSTQLSIRLVYAQSVRFEIKTEIRFCLLQNNFRCFICFFAFFVFVFLFDKSLNACIESLKQTMKPSSEYRDWIFFCNRISQKRINFSLPVVVLVARMEATLLNPMLLICSRMKMFS